MTLTCNECGKTFRVSSKNMDPSCPKCGGVDVEPASFVFVPKWKVASRNYSAGPFDFAWEGN